MRQLDNSASVVFPERCDAKDYVAGEYYNKKGNAAMRPTPSSKLSAHATGQPRLYGSLGIRATWTGAQSLHRDGVVDSIDGAMGPTSSSKFSAHAWSIISMLGYTVKKGMETYEV